MSPEIKKKAVFLDRDGTIIEDRGHIGNPNEIRLFPETVPALRMLSNNYLLFIVTNQSGVAQNIITKKNVDDVNAKLLEILSECGISIEQVFVCPHGKDDGCVCRKPSPFFLRKAAKEHGIDISSSYMIGDHPSDIGTAISAGANAIYLLSGHGQKHMGELPENGFQILPEILSAAEWIVKKDEISKIYGSEYSRTVESAAEKLRDGGIGVMPTETVYGLAGNALSPDSAAKIFDLKKRPHFDPLIVHVASIQEIQSLAIEIPDAAMRLLRRYWPGPLTVVLKKSKVIPGIVSSGLDTVALRMPRHPIALDLIRKAGFPLAAPSANIFSMTSPTCVENLSPEIAAGSDFILDGGKCQFGIESSIVSFENPAEPVLLRPGSLPIEEISETAGISFKIHEDNGNGKILAPGLLKKHYSTATKFELAKYNRVISPEIRSRSAFISFDGADVPEGFLAVETLSITGDMREAAARLFDSMSKLDRMNLDFIFAGDAPQHGLGLAINDRLRKAAGKG